MCNQFPYIKRFHRQTAVPLMALGGLQEVWPLSFWRFSPLTPKILRWKFKKLKIDNVGWRTWQNSSFFLVSRLYDFWVWYLVRLLVCLEGIRCCNKLPDALIPGKRSCVTFPRSTWAWNLCLINHCWYGMGLSESCQNRFLKHIIERLGWTFSYIYIYTCALLWPCICI